MVQQPTDPVIHQMLGDRAWNATLSGAAAGMALRVNRGQALTPWLIRETAWRAGYLHPISRARTWTTAPSTAPPDEMLTWIQTLSEEVDLGLVRARSNKQDLWLALVATPTMQLDPLPRQVPIGSIIQLPELEGHRYRVADADGHLEEGTLDLPHKIVANSQGEWLMQLVGDKGTVTFPVYVGLVPPDELLFPKAPLLPESDRLADEKAAEMLNELRLIYGREVWERDPVLDATATAVLRGDKRSGKELANRLGYSPDGFARWECLSPSLEACLDTIVWDPAARPALLGATDLFGLAATAGPKAVHVVVLVASGGD